MLSVRETVKSTYITAGVQWNPINYIHPNINVIVTLEKINCLLKWRKIFRCSPKMAVISYPWTVALSSSVVSSLPLSSLACLAVGFIGDSVSEKRAGNNGKTRFLRLSPALLRLRCLFARSPANTLSYAGYLLTARSSSSSSYLIVCQVSILFAVCLFLCPPLKPLS